MVFVKTRQTCPSVSTGRRYYSRYRGASGSTADKENAQLDSWTVGGSLRRPCPLSLNRPCSGDERKRRRIDSCFRRHVEFPRCRWDVSIELRGFVFGSSEWPIATRNVPPDFLWPPLTSFPGLRPISMIAGAKLIFPKHLVDGEESFLSISSRGNQDALVIIIILCPCGNRFPCPALRGEPTRQSEFIRVGSNREDCYHDFFSVSRMDNCGNRRWSNFVRCSFCELFYKKFYSVANY